MTRYLVADSNTNGFCLHWNGKNVRAQVAGKPIAIVEALGLFHKFRNFSHDDVQLFLDDWLVITPDWPFALRALVKSDAEVDLMLVVHDSNDGIYHAERVWDECIPD